MSFLLASIRQTAATCPDKIALQGAEDSLSYAALNQAITQAAEILNNQNILALGLLADNGLPWAVADLSALTADIPLVPIPLFFSPQQILHLLQDARLDGLLTDQPQQVATLLTSANIQFHPAGPCCGLHLIRLIGVAAPVMLPVGTAKITYTSGTTGEPKGVCLSLAQMEAVAVSLRDASLATPTDRHLCLTPLSTLLENIGGIYTPLMAGASSHLLPLQQVGLGGASSLDIARLLQALHQQRASSAILAPQMLQALVMAAENGAALPATLRFVAVGGASVAPSLLQRSQHLGIPVFEGYGLSECASVVALNTPLCNRPGSVGQPLPHVKVSIDDDGEVLVSGANFLGYLGETPPAQPLPTGDLGHLDEAGFLHISGRKKSQFITSFGRNVAPEWVERELTLHPAIVQAAVFGEARCFNVAVLVLRAGFSHLHIESAVKLANQILPDYARVTSWLVASTPFTPSNGQLTSNGRLRRAAIHAAHADALESLFQEQPI